MKLREIRNYNFSHERALYAAKNIKLKQCNFRGEEDGESALKEAKNIIAEDCMFCLRYPMWHNKNTTLKNVRMATSCRAALWYCDGIKIDGSEILGIKALRESCNADINKSYIVSPEFGWKCKNINISDATLQSEYAFLMSQNLTLNNVRFKGKYAFQYVENAVIENCSLDTKDAFWHSENVVVRNCEVNGEYLGWYSHNLTFINCRISGTQPLCYCKGLKLVDCIMQGTDLSFEYSDVNAKIKGKIVSVKNVRSGKIVADRIGAVIVTPDSKVKQRCKIITQD